MAIKSYQTTDISIAWIQVKGFVLSKLVRRVQRGSVVLQCRFKDIEATPANPSSFGGYFLRNLRST
jgi:hypothetical protein